MSFLELFTLLVFINIILVVFTNVLQVVLHKLLKSNYKFVSWRAVTFITLLVAYIILLVYIVYIPFT